ncbi:MAG TPA: aminotransferase class V-fold PLP-dependent enzyme [Chitinophagales bacterium]|nr:aminotransferase class V-fold PLP-dependent enzyme [Chitinophagales bacterium]
MLSRKKFIQRTALATAGLSLLDFMEPVQAAVFKEHLNRVTPLNPALVAQDEDFWQFIRSQYTVSPNVINLNNGGVSPQPKPVQDAHIRYYQYSNEAPSLYMWRVLDQGREPLRDKLAEMAGCLSEEIAINRNSTEGLNTIIFGLNLKAGDEVVLSKYDYPNMMNAWRQREKRDGVKLIWVDFDLPVESDEAFVQKFAAAITPNTKIVHITHMLNWTGQILPARKIADMAHSKGCEVIVDASHTFAHIDYKIPDLGCDYYATSLHKWLCAPFGTGMMYIKKGKVKNVWALLSAPIPDADNVGKFESLGTRSFAAEMAIGNAVDFQHLVGAKRKEERLRYLKNYWCNKAAKIPGFKLYTSLKDEYSCAIANFTIEGLKPEDIDTQLFEKWKIHTTTVNHEKVHGVRVTPHVYTSLYDLDRLVTAIKEIAGNK